ncbi:MAG: SMP-30/gluconolactonase/LRE family protein [Myxococcota bacterium]
MLSAILALAGCTPTPVLRGSSPEVAVDDGVVLAGGSGAVDSGPTSIGTYSTDDGCSDLPSTAVSLPVQDYWTGADFDFDGLGRLVSIDGNLLLGWSGAESGVEILAYGVEVDTRSLQVDHDGGIVVSSYQAGTVVRFNPATGVSLPIIGGMDGPGGLEIGEPGVVYVAESGTGRIYEIGASGMATSLGAVPYPAQLALSPAMDVLYVSDLAEGTIWAFDHADDRWSGPRPVVTTVEPMAAIEVDSCGNLYGVAYGSGAVFRFDPDTGEHTRLTTLPVSGYGAFVSARWGSDRGPWRRDVLYVSDTQRIFAVDVGVVGRDQPVDVLP